MSHAIPTKALDDRLGFIGTSGSGKTYNAGGAVEILRWLSANGLLPEPGVHLAKKKPDDVKTSKPGAAKARPAAADDEIPA